jgi:hypothetical protein
MPQSRRPGWRSRATNETGSVSIWGGVVLLLLAITAFATLFFAEELIEYFKGTSPDTRQPNVAFRLTDVDPPLDDYAREVHNGWLLEIQAGQVIEFPFENVIDYMSPCALRWTGDLPLSVISDRRPDQVNLEGFPVPPFDDEVVRCGISSVALSFLLQQKDAEQAFQQVQEWFHEQYFMLPESSVLVPPIPSYKTDQGYLRALFAMPTTPLCEMRPRHSTGNSELLAGRGLDAGDKCLIVFKISLDCPSQQGLSLSGSENCRVGAEVALFGGNRLILSGSKWDWLDEEWRTFMRTRNR